MIFLIVFFFKQKTAYEMRISDWSSDVCSSDLDARRGDDILIRERPQCDVAFDRAGADLFGLADAGGRSLEALEQRASGCGRRGVAEDRSRTAAIGCLRKVRQSRAGG